MTLARNRERSWSNWWWVAPAVFAIGCSDSQTLRLADYLDELDVEALAERRAEASVGKYAVPVALTDDHGDVGWRLLEFELYAVTSPEDKDAVEQAWKRRQGQFQDQVIAICRGISAEELDDGRLTTLKARLFDMAKPLLGADRIQQLLIVADSTDAI